MHNYSHLELLGVFTGYLKVLSILPPQRVELFMKCLTLQEEIQLLKQETSCHLKLDILPQHCSYVAQITKKHELVASQCTNAPCSN